MKPYISIFERTVFVFTLLHFSQKRQHGSTKIKACEFADYVLNKSPKRTVLNHSTALAYFSVCREYSEDYRS